MAVNIPIISEYSPKGIQAAIKDFKRLETRTEKAGFALRKAFVPATAALGGLAAAAVPAVKAASDLEESMSKVNVIFGEGAETVTQFAQTAATQLGLSQQAVLDAAGTFGTFGKAAGLSGQDLAQFNNDFTTLAADLASFNNTTPQQAIDAIGASLRGESEPLRAYGVLLDDATLKAEALELGIYDGSGALTAQQKILAAQAAIYKQTGDAQGDFARTSEGLAGQTKIMQAQFSDLQAEIGQALMPVIMKLLPMVADLATFVSENIDLIMIFSGVIGGLAGAIVAINFAMKAWAATQAAYTAVSALATKATVLFSAALWANPITWIVAGIAGLVAGLIILEKKFGLVTETLKAMFGVLEKVGDAIGWVAEKLGLASDELDENFTPTVDEAREAAGDMYESVREAGNGADEARAQFEKATGQLDDFKDAATESERPTDNLTDAVDELWKSTDRLYQGMFDLNPELQRYLDQLDRDAAVRDFNDAVAEFEAVAKNNEEGSREWEEATAEVYRELGNVVTELGNIPQETQTDLKFFVDTGELERAQAIIDRINEGLRIAKTQSGGVGVPGPGNIAASLQAGGFVGTTVIAPEVPTTVRDETGTAGIRVAAPTMSTISTERGSATVTNNVTVNTLNANAETGRNIADALAAYQRVRGFVN